MADSTKTSWDGQERRSTPCRRQGDRRRAGTERRCDTRSGARPKRTLYLWFRSIVNSRLGVDRRKTPDQRMRGNRRSALSGAMLTKEELDDLLN